MNTKALHEEFCIESLPLDGGLVREQACNIFKLYFKYLEKPNGSLQIFNKPKKFQSLYKSTLTLTNEAKIFPLIVRNQIPEGNKIGSCFYQ